MMTIPNGARRTITGRELRQIPREMREIIKLAQDQGWSVWKTQRNHFRFRPPAGSPQPGRPAGHEDNRAGGRTLTHGSTDSDRRAMSYFRTELRRAGLEGV